ncbi:hypothetical protein [Methylocucumis oryzae]|uniref:Uncharacterized protein n=1 Tax=Methylocucumis oryzae TaxID=1632867 RepID=A0A0F3IMY5_9GAMM|nr:hypothetical protein [Methylocucumis oryzae]KJV08066.1 hypothetical protein VZ94_00460 [Methylocucumis oryzae]
MTLTELVGRYVTEEKPDTLLLDSDTVMAQAVTATLFYAGYAAITSEPTTIDSSTELSYSEWALIRPLFLLYVDRETAVQLEASRMMGVDVFGRSTSEVMQEIMQAENELAHKAFYRDIETF